MKHIAKPTAILAVLIAATFGLTAFANTGLGNGFILDRLIEMKQAQKSVIEQDLNLTPAQKTEIQEIRKDAWAQAEPLIQQMVKQQKELVQYMASPTANKNEALKRRDAIASSRSELAAIQINAVLKVKSLLSPAQQERSAELINQKILYFEANQPLLKEKLSRLIFD